MFIYVFGGQRSLQKVLLKHCPSFWRQGFPTSLEITKKVILKSQWDLVIHLSLPSQNLDYKYKPRYPCLVCKVLVSSSGLHACKTFMFLTNYSPNCPHPAYSCLETSFMGLEYEMLPNCLLKVILKFLFIFWVLLIG